MNILLVFRNHILLVIGGPGCQTFPVVLSTAPLCMERVPAWL